MDKKEDITKLLKSKGMCRKTIQTYNSIIQKVIKNLGNSFTEKEFENYLNNSNLKPRSYNLYRAVINFYTKEKLGYEIKFSKAKQDKFLPIEVTEEEFNIFLSKIPNLKHRIGFKLMYQSGLRVKEVVNLKKQDINLERLTIRVRGKGNKDRYTILSPETAVELKDYLKKLNRKNLYVFQNKKTNLTVKTFQERLKKAISDSKLKYFTCHSLRSGFAINLVNKGIDIEIVRRLLGHSSIKTTQIYLKCRTIDLTKIAKTI